MGHTFKDRVAIVTAGGAGIGAATCSRFAEEGASVVVADLSGKRAQEVATKIQETGGIAQMIKMDASDPEGVAAMVKLALDSYGRIDIMCNNAGLGALARLEDTSMEIWERTIGVSLTSTFLGMKHCLPIMQKQRSGTIINTASVSGLVGDFGMSAYNAAKAGVINLSRSAAIENAEYNIRVNCVCPGAIDTRAVQILGGASADTFRRAQSEAHPLGRMGQSEEIANTILFLASDNASFITGQALAVDGGLTSHTGLPNMLNIARPQTPSASTREGR